MPDFLKYENARRFGGVPRSYLDEEAELLPPLEEDEEDLPRDWLAKGGGQITPELRRIIGGSSRPSGEAFEVAEAKRKNDAYAEIAGKPPEQSKPKWWKALAGAGAGFAMGYADARRPGSIDIKEATSGLGRILNHKDERKLADWQRKKQAAGEERDAAERNRDAWWKNRDREGAEELRGAQVDRYRADAERDRAMAEAAQVQWKVDGRGRFYNPSTGEIKNPAPTPKERFDEAKSLGATDEQARFYSLNGKMPEPKPEPQKVPGRDVPYSPEVEEQRRRMQPPRATAGGSAAGGSEADDIAQAIIDGNQPPDMKGLYRFGGPVRAKLGKAGYDLTTATKDWQAVTRHLSTLNGPQQERLRQAVNFTYDSLDQIEQLYNEWKQAAGVSGLKVLNRANLAVSKQLGGKAGEVAQNLEAQINDLTSELGTVYKGGNSSTDESLRLAGENLKADWNEQTFKRALEQIRKNLQIRRNSIMSSQPVGVSENSAYVPQSGGRGASTPAKADPLGIR